MTTTDKQLTAEELQEFELYQKLKPYIGHCMILNHELNNPLTGIIGFGEFLVEDDDVPESTKKSVRMILKSAEKMQKLIEALCADKIELDAQINLAEVIDSYKKSAKDLEL